MGAHSQTDILTVPEAQRARHVWAAIIVGSILFFGLCALLASGVWNYANTVTTPQTAAIQLSHGTQLVVQRRRSVTSELITNTTTLQAGDQATTGEDSEAFVQLFNGSVTVHTFFSTTLRIDKLDVTRFFQNTKEVNLYVGSGTAIMATGALGDYSSNQYTITTNQAEITVSDNTRVRVSVKGSADQETTQLVVDSGSATLQSHGKKIDLAAALSTSAPAGSPASVMASVTGNDPPIGPVPAEDELVQNGNFDAGPTSHAEQVENGGLGTAAWLPIRDQSSGASGGFGSTTVETEKVAGAFQYANIKGDGQGKFVRVGIRQEINRAVEFFQSIELAATVNVVSQSERAGGPQGNAYPLMINILYSDAQGNTHSWTRSFYYQGPAPAGETSSFLVPLARWSATADLAQQKRDVSKGQPSPFLLKSTTAGVGTDVAVINAIEIYGYGTQFESRVTGVSLVAR
ncbi:MAG: hypothetical protein IVW55_10450 [Chloroflexi bacterium]|nr:hypothetical protein [Chloroflexota bacterium]